MAVPKKRRSKNKVNIHRTLGYFYIQKFYKYREYLLLSGCFKKEVEKKVPTFEQLA